MGREWLNNGIRENGGLEYVEFVDLVVKYESFIIIMCK